MVFIHQFKEDNTDITDAVNSSKFGSGQGFYSIERFNETNKVDNRSLSNPYNFNQLAKTNNV